MTMSSMPDTEIDETRNIKLWKHIACSRSYNTMYAACRLISEYHAYCSVQNIRIVDKLILHDVIKISICRSVLIHLVCNSFRHRDIIIWLSLDVF